ncbi:AEC family transporter [Ammoniphilus sp. YIM 78166]|uniref:AEC family transporter n=1 Tax=Ammoniphilus sp. YIM 78166 TaxID=1644106 RepID=UPI0010705C49|nr:AEC family transporter [Ammoniphilus sp. YIM 78166]
MLTSFWLTLYQVFLPLSFPVIGGALLYRFHKLDTKGLALLALYILSPALIFDSIYKAEISVHDVSTILFFSITNLLVLWGIASFLGRVFTLSAAETAGLTMVSTFTNCVNYGLPLVLLAFGKSGMHVAAIYVIVQIIIVNTIGVYFAARSQFTIRQALISVFRMPAIYAAILAFGFRSFHLDIPLAVEKGLLMLSTAYAPVVLAILGVQMMSARQMEIGETYRKAFKAGIGIRLIAAPVIAYLILVVLGAKGVLFSVLLLLASMPAAVNAVILAERFNAAPQFVSRCVLWTTVCSFFVLPIFLRLLN